MISRRNLILRLSIAFNVAVLVYVATGMTGHDRPAAVPSPEAGRPADEEASGGGGGVAAPAQSSSGRNLASIESAGVAEAAEPPPPPVEVPTSSSQSPSRAPPGPSSPEACRPDEAAGPSPPGPSPLASALGCRDHRQRPPPKYLQRGDHWVLLNYVRAERTFGCAESVTYTTHGDFSFLDNLPSLLERWGGPVSLALFAPGDDFGRTLDAVSFARSCLSPLVRELVTFHLYFGVKDVPIKVPRPDEADFPPEYDCEGRPPPLPWGNGTGNGTTPYTSYKSRKNILYPVNVGRNIARGAATTHFVLPSDIELYPSPGLIGAFLDLVARESEEERRVEAPRRPVHRVYVLSIFEIASNMSQPDTKPELVRMLRNGSAIPFHKKLCAGCHAVPRAKEWQEAPGEDRPGATLGVFHVGKRTGSYHHWEPIFIGTDDDPPYDERLSWEGKSDKMTQGYALCALDYEFRILDNAFLVHRPGIKTYKKDPKRLAMASKTNSLIKKVIEPELKVLYGTRKGCIV
ncbi:beta-1,4-glucuronyltransferase 1 [Hetaerina americana]|uniref:beta-1,4-glucuronyltransferase 1 n=1 Tax=Hetaerina americana TaxID=62018 RepID=UPI003A7F313E